MNQNGLGKLLLQGNFLTSDKELENLIKDAHERNESLITTLSKNKKIEYATIANFISKQLLLPYLDLDFFDINHIPGDIDLKILENTKILPIKKTSNSITVATSDPTNQHIHDLKFQINVNNIHIVVVEENKLHTVIAKYLQSKGMSYLVDISDIEAEGLFEEKIKIEEKIDTEVEDAPVVKFIQSVLLEAIKLKVSDIHFEPYEKTYRIRFRLDGVLSEFKKVPLILKEKIASRIKVISDMDISEKRVPQDGRFKIPLSKDKSIDFRVSSLPTIWGEKIVMRILDSSASSLDIDKLGYDDAQKELLLNAVRRPYGMVLVTGPTGSGKTISLYSCMNILNDEGVNICTAEDPVEINLPGINQVNTNEKAGLTFSTALKSFLRQDPDTILVGEIRDLETADIAIKAAQTGHMVLSTLHTNDAPKTITRLLNMGVKPFNIASSIILITAQRLARRLCPHCKEKEIFPVEVILEAGLDPDDLIGYGKSWHTYKPVGCSECNDRGYKGRVGIYQVMPITEEIRRIILREGTDIEIAMESRTNGVLSLREAGMKKVKEGITSMEEVLATTNVD